MSICALTILIWTLTSFIYCAEYNDILVISVATEINDAADRFLRSARINNFNVKIIGEGLLWRGGDINRYPGGGFKVNLLKDELEKYKENKELLILFVDSYDVLLLSDKTELLEKYKQLGGGVIFSAEEFCWPNKELAESYPPVAEGEKRFLNSGGFIGPASDIYTIVSANPIEDTEDDQLYYTLIFLNPEYRDRLNIKLDSSSLIFRNLNGALDEVDLEFNDETGYIVNKMNRTRPVILHGNGPIKIEFNSLSNYLVHTWTPTRGCQHCSENRLEMTKLEDYPIILLSVFIEQPTPFLEVFFQRIANLTYPKSRMHFFGHVQKSAAFQKKICQAFNTTEGHKYRSITWLDDEELDEAATRKNAFAYCLAIEDCKYMMSVDGVAHFTAPSTIEHLVALNRSMVAPLLTRRGKLWSNFWGALSPSGYYERSDDYIDIVEGTKRGLWNVPYIRDAYIISRNALRQLMDAEISNRDVDMSITSVAREKNIFLYVDNQYHFGYLMNADNYTTEHLHNDLWQIFDNPLDWEERYIDGRYFDVAKPEVNMMDVSQPCPDVFWFPMLTKTFCKQLIEEMEYFGEWSNGDNNDPRLEGGYENVPTRDIHMRQVNWEEHWIHVLRTYVYPMQKKLYQGYDDKPWARMNFVVRYKPDEQANLRPHHDASSYTLNICLNQPGVDYQGGGIRYVRYNCSITDTRVGWVVMSPGRVTHLHEGLTTTAGTRYIFVTFVNP